MEDYFVIQLANGYFLWWTYHRNHMLGMQLKCGGMKTPHFATKVDVTCLNEDTLNDIKNRFPGAKVVRVQTNYQIIESHPTFPF